MSARVTWLLPVRNGMPYLPETLASIEAQTYRQWEVLAWDNGSTDGTLEELQRWIPGRLPGRVVRDRPMGLGASLAAMVEEARTEYCARIDADDVNLPRRLERQVAALDANPRLAVVGSQVVNIDENGEIRWFQWRRPVTHEDLVLFFVRGSPIPHPSALLRREAVLGVGNYRDVKPVEDYDLWMRLAKRYELGVLDEVLLRYRIHDQSVSQSAKAAGTLQAPTLACFLEHAGDLFGCRPESLRSLHLRRHKCTFLGWLRVAWLLERRRRIGLLRRIRSETFIASGRFLTPDWDLFSRALFHLLRKVQVQIYPRLELAEGRVVCLMPRPGEYQPLEVG